MYNSLKSLSNNFNIILVSFIEDTAQEQNLPELNKVCKKVFTILRRPSRNAVFDKIYLPIFIKNFYSRRLEERIKLCRNDFDIDFVQIEYINMAYYAKSISGVPKVLIEHDASIYALANSYQKPVFGRLLRFFDWLNLRRFQKLIYRHIDKIVTFTEEDYKIVQRAASKSKVSVIPIGIESARRELPAEQEKTIDILFVGHMLHYPNIDGLNYFIDKIFPLIKRGIPDVKFQIAGSNMRQAKINIKKDRNTEIVGEVGDIKPLFARSKLLVVPIRLGGGIKVKILEAMAMGLAVVATRQAARGLKVTSGKDICLADSANDFALNVLGLLRDDSKRKLIAENARETAARCYDIKQMALAEESLYRSLSLDDNKKGGAQCIKLSTV